MPAWRRSECREAVCFAITLAGNAKTARNRVSPEALTSASTRTPATIEGPTPVPNDTCDCCGKTEDGIGWIAAAYRKVQLRHSRPDPGNLCGACAGSDTGKRIAAEVLNSEEQ